MGSPMLKRKKEFNYRRGTTAHNCAECNAFVRNFEVTAIGGQVMRTEPRCMLMGLKSGRAYRINPNNVCDAHDNSEFLKRLRGY